MKTTKVIQSACLQMMHGYFPLWVLVATSYVPLTQSQIGSVALFGLYIIVKKFGTEWINFLLGWYFSIAGIGSVWQVCRFFNFILQFCCLIFLQSSISLTRYLLGDARWKQFDMCRFTAKKGAASRDIHQLFILPQLIMLQHCLQSAGEPLLSISSQLLPCRQPFIRFGLPAANLS